MKETSFINQNKEKWKEYEKILESDTSKDPEKMSDLFVQITDDLSYSRTFYPYRSVRVYLNNLAQQIFNSIYKNKKSGMSRLFSFWTEEMPQIVWESRKEFMFALGLFVVSFLIGALSCVMDPDFASVILGQNYVDMTIENIKSGDPMRVYKEEGEWTMWLGITWNNLMVAFRTFILGVFFAIGTIGILVQNGIMVGAFQFFFYEKGVFLDSFLTIWIHGTLEISAIIIAGAAGITMGKGLVFPGTYTRLQAFQISARRGLKIMIGVVPLFVLAAFFEGYLTRYTETPNIVRGLFIALNLAFVLWYYYFYPKKKAMEGFAQPLSLARLPADASQRINFNRIKTSGEILPEIFIVYKKRLGQIFVASIISALVFCGCIFPFTSYSPSSLFSYTWAFPGSTLTAASYFSHEDINWIPIINMVIYSVLTYMVLVVVAEMNNKNIPEEDRKKPKHILNFIQVTALMLVPAIFLYFSPIILIILLFPLVLSIILLGSYVIVKEQKNLFDGMGRAFTLMGGNVGKIYGLFYLIVFIGIAIFQIIDTSMAWMYVEFLSWNLTLEKNELDELVVVFLTFTSKALILLLYPLLAIGMGLLYSTLVETREAPSLNKRIEQIQLGKKIQGIEQEAADW